MDETLHRGEFSGKRSERRVCEREEYTTRAYLYFAYMADSQTFSIFKSYLPFRKKQLND